MKDIIVAYPSKKTALHLAGLLEEGGVSVSHVCALGASVLQIAEELAERLPFGFDVLAIGMGTDGMSNLVFMHPPLDYADFINTALVLSMGSGGTARRDNGGQEAIDKAKEILACTRGFTEPEAHRYLQRMSMESGKKLEAVAREIIDELL